MLLLFCVHIYFLLQWAVFQLDTLKSLSPPVRLSFGCWLGAAWKTKKDTNSKFWTLQFFGHCNGGPQKWKAAGVDTDALLLKLFLVLFFFVCHKSDPLFLIPCFLILTRKKRKHNEST